MTPVGRTEALRAVNEFIESLPTLTSDHQMDYFEKELENLVRCLDVSVTRELILTVVVDKFFDMVTQTLTFYLFTIIPVAGRYIKWSVVHFFSFFHIVQAQSLIISFAVCSVIEIK